MATLVLTAVGGIVGGPIGAALGGLAGQAIDRTVLAPKGRRGPRLTELAVQTSAYGTPLPRLFGRMRVAGCVIWSTDLIETRHKDRAAKGQPATTSYSYSASFAVALSARPIIGVGRIWAEGKLLRGAAGDFKSRTGFRLHLGGEGQAADPLIAAAEGAAAPAHRGLAYAVFEDFQLADYGNRLPSLTFEVLADAGPVTVGAIAAELAPLAAAAPGLTLDGFSAYGDGVRGVLEPLTDASGAWFAPVPGGLALRDGGAAVALAQPQRRARTIAPVETVPRTLTLAHYDPARDYQAGVQRAERPGAGRRGERVELPAALDAAAARGVAQAMLARAERGRVRRTLTLDARHIGVAPGSCVTLAGEAGTWRVTRAEVERMTTMLTLLPLTPAARPVSSAAGRVAAAADLRAGTTLLVAAELPPLDEPGSTQPLLTVAAAGTDAGWRGATLLLSSDGGASWQEAGATAAPATMGTLDAALAAGPVTLLDRVNAITLTVPHDAMAFAAADAMQRDAGANLLLVGEELLQFADAIELAPRRWQLRGLARGRRGSAAAAHPAGTRAVLLETATAQGLRLPASAVGATVALLAGGIGNATAVRADVAVRGASLAPPAPVRLRATVQPDGTCRVTWRRRSRAGWRWQGGGDVPLVEEMERYRVRIEAGGTAREIVVSEPAATVSADERAAGPVGLSIVQLGTHAASPPATLTLEEDT